MYDECKWRSNEAAITQAASQLGIPACILNNKTLLRAFLEGNNVFVSLPTGSRESFCYAEWYLICIRL